MKPVAAMRPFCEVCCPSLEAVAKAVAAGADRIELCERLEVGGVTPSEQLIKDALAVAGAVPVNVLIRPREGNFVYSEEEAKQMLASIELCKALRVVAGTSGPRLQANRSASVPVGSNGKALRVNGVVIGALRSDGSVDMDLMRRLVDAARPHPGDASLSHSKDAIRPLAITFHRAFDESRDPYEALEDIIGLGIERLLTSGHAPTAWEGRFVLKELVERASTHMGSESSQASTLQSADVAVNSSLQSTPRIVIMPGCGVTPANLPALAAFTRATEFHGSKILPE